MNFDKTVGRYHTASIALHWLMLALFVAVYASIELRVLFAKGTEPREAMKSLHFMLGLLVFGLVWLRLLMRALHPAPEIRPTPSKWQALSALAAHAALYVFMVGMPLVGWISLSAAGKPIPFFGLELPALVGPDKALARQVKEVHEVVGNVGYFLIGVHTLAALFHHFIQRDNTLTRMLPGRAGA